MRFSSSLNSTTMLILNMMENFEQFVNEHSIDDNLLYNSNALCGECGEVANVIKKIEIRNKLNSYDVISMRTMDEYNENLVEELGDSLFYLVKIANKLGITLDDIMKNQYNKLTNQDIKYGRVFKK